MSYDTYDIAAAAEKVGVSSRTIQRRIESGKLPGAVKDGGRWFIPEPTLAAAFPDAFATKYDNYDTKDDSVNDNKYDNYDTRTGAEYAADSQLIKQLQDDLERERQHADDLAAELRTERAHARETAAQLAKLADQAQQLELAQLQHHPELVATEQTDGPATEKFSRRIFRAFRGRQ